MIGYALGFALGNILGITLEERVALGYVQVNIVSCHHKDDIVGKLRESKFGVTILPAEGKSGELSILIALIKRKYLNSLITQVKAIGKQAFYHGADSQVIPWVSSWFLSIIFFPIQS